MFKISKLIVYFNIKLYYENNLFENLKLLQTSLFLKV